jgi:hypothetical protein
MWPWKEVIEYCKSVPPDPWSNGEIAALVIGISLSYFLITGFTARLCYGWQRGEDWKDPRPVIWPITLILFSGSKLAERILNRSRLPEAKVVKK